MAGITLELAQSHLDAYLAAEVAALSGKSYSIGGRSLSRQDLSEIRKGVEVWDARVKRFSNGRNGGIRLRVGVPQ
jgi:hypothetical protein